MFDRRSFLKLPALGLLPTSQPEPKWELYGDEAAVELGVGAEPFELVPGRPGTTLTVTQVRFQVVGVTAMEDYVTARFAVWFGTDQSARVDSIRFDAPPGKPGISAYPEAWTCSCSGPTGIGVTCGFGPQLGGRLHTGEVAVRIRYH